MKRQMIERYMNAVAELANKFDNYTDSGALLADYQKVWNEVASRTAQLAEYLGLEDSNKYVNESLKILRTAYSKAAVRISNIERERKTNEAIEFVSTLL